MAACKQRASEYVGKEFCLEPRNILVISTMLTTCGYSIDDVTILNFADDATAANALASGMDKSDV